MVEVTSNNYVVHNLFSFGEVYLDQADDIKATYFGDHDVLDDTAIVHNGSRNRSRRNDATADDDDDDDDDEDFDVDDQVDICNGNYTHDQMIDHCKRSLIMTILALIYMNEFPLTEEELFSAIKDFGLSEEYPIESRHGMLTLRSTLFDF